MSKLKESVVNSDLEYLGVIKSSIPVSGQVNLYQNTFNLSDNITVKAKVVSGGGVFCNNLGTTYGTEIDMTNNALAFKEGSIGNVIFQYLEKSNVLFGLMNFDKLQYSDDIIGLLSEALWISGHGTYYSEGFVGNITKYFPNLKSIKLTSQTHIYGRLSDFGGLINLSYLGLWNANSIPGSLEELAEAQITAGRTSGTLVVVCNTLITYNGVVVGNNVSKTITFSNGSYTVS